MPLLMIGGGGGGGMGGRSESSEEGGDSKPSSFGKKKESEGPGLMDMARRRSVKKIAMALGADPNEVDLDALDQALTEHYEACSE